MGIPWFFSPPEAPSECVSVPKDPWRIYVEGHYSAV
jgi:hypothetical protein